MKFEGEEVDGGSEVVIRQFRGDIEVPLVVDEIVQMKVIAKVAEVTHKVNERTGQLTRSHIMKVQEVEVE